MTSIRFQHRQHVQTHTLSTTRSFSTPRHNYDPVILNYNTTSFESPTTKKRKNNSNHYTTSSSYYNLQSRAERTMNNTHRASRPGLFPHKFVRTFHTSNGKQYPEHPDGPETHSRFPILFDGRFGYSGRHPFRECGLSTDPITKQNFQFDLQCHNPNVYFKLSRHTMATNT